MLHTDTVKLSAAARETLLDRSYRWQTLNIWVGHGNNAALRELEANGLIDRVRFGWSEERILTRAGCELAGKLFDEKERLRCGVPISEYRLEKQLSLSKPGFASVEIERGWIHSNGHLIALGRALNESNLPRLTAELLAQMADKYMPDPAPGDTISPRKYFQRDRFSFIEFDNGKCAQSRYYSHILRLFPKSTWRSHKETMYAIQDGHTVATVMTFKI